MMGDLEAGESTALLPKNGEISGKNAKSHDDVTVVIADEQVAELMLHMFMANFRYSADLSRYPKSNPKLPPVVRFKRHRNFYIFEINQFRHWWKTSR